MALPLSRRFLLSCILAVATILLHQGCTSATVFVFSNRSEDAVVTLTYTVPAHVQRLGEPSCVTPDSLAPAVAPADQMSRWHGTPDWAALSKSDYEFDPRTCTYTVEVQPGLSLRLAHGRDYTGPTEQAYGFPLGSLHIESHGSTVAHDSPKELQHHFRRRQRALFEYAYENVTSPTPQAGAA